MDCKHSGCVRPAEVKGHCRPHYHQFRNYGETYDGPRRVRGVCSLDGCEDPHQAKGFCGKHYRRNKYYGSPALALPPFCALCGVGEGDATLHVDHDHACCPTRKRSCGKCVRGLLCSNCNTAIGLLRDDPELIRKAANYVSS